MNVLSLWLQLDLKSTVYSRGHSPAVGFAMILKRGSVELIHTTDPFL